MKEQLSSQDLLTARFRHKKSALSFAIIIIAFLTILSSSSFADLGGDNIGGEAPPLSIKTATTDLVFPRYIEVTLYDDLGDGGYRITTGSGGTTSPAGSDTQVQFNDSGSFGGDSGFIFNKTSNTATVDIVSVITALQVGSDYISDITGSGLSIVGGVLTAAGGSGDAVTVNSTAIDTTANIKDSTDITYAITDGGAGGPDDIAGTVVNDSHNHTTATIADSYLLNTGDTSTGALTINDNDGVDNENLAIIGDADDLDNLIVYGNVGIGTTGPGELLDVRGTIATSVGIDGVGAVDLDYGSADITDHTFITDGTGTAEIVLPNDSIGDTEIDWGTGAGQVSSADMTFDADSVINTAVYTGTTSLEETTGATDSGAYIVGAFDEFAFSASTTVQAVLNDLDSAIPDYYQYTLLPESAILDDGAPPAITIIESTGTNTPRFRVADFDPTTDEIIYWTFIVPDDMAAGNWLADVSWYSNDIGANETCVWGLAISATSEADADTMAEQAAPTIDYASEDVNTTEVNRLIQTTITISDLDSVAAGDIVTLCFRRDADSTGGTDDLSSDSRLVAVRLRIPRT